MPKALLFLTLLSFLAPFIIVASNADWEQKLLDDPETERKFLEKQLEDLDFETDTKAWLNSYHRWQRTLNEAASSLDTEGLARFAKLANEQDLPFIAQDLERLSIDALPAAQKSEQESKTLLYQKFIQKLEAGSDPQIMPLAWLSLGLHYDAVGLAPLAMEAYQKAFTLLETTPSPSVLTRMNLMSSISVILYNDGKFDQALDLKRQILSACKSNGWRYFCADAYYNMGSMLTQQSDPTLLNQAAEAFQEGERLAKSINSAHYLARIHYGWLKYYTARGAHAKALSYGNLALKEFGELHDRQFLSATGERLARVYVATGQLEAASQSVLSALQTLEDKDYGRKKELYFLLYEIEKKRQKPSEALTALEAFTQLVKDQNLLKDSKDFNKLAADLGLKFEAEKSKALQAELALHSTQRQAALALLGLSMLAFFLLFAYFRQIRQLQKLRYREKVAREQEKNQKIIQLESELRFNLASSVAHHINNPLNQIGLSLDHLQTNQKSLHTTINALVGDDAEDDPEGNTIRKTLRDFLATDLELRTQIRDSLSQTSTAVSELRTLSGVDGCARAPYKLEELRRTTLNRLRELLSAKDFERFIFTIQPEDMEASFSGNLFLSKNALELLITNLLDLSKDTLQLVVSRHSPNSLLLRYEGTLDPDPTLISALELSMSNILKPSLVKAEYKPGERAFHFVECKEGG